MAGVGVAEASGRTAQQKLALAHQALLRDRDLQFDFALFPQPKPPGWLKVLGDILKAVGPYLQYVFWAGLAIGAAMLLWFILREIVPDRWFRRRSGVTATDWRPAPEAAQALLQDAEGLAAQGRFEDAIHLLLFRSIDDLSGRRPGAVKPALTSRDIASLEVLPPQARAAFARLAQAVERTFFGGLAAGPPEFEQAREDYRAFAFAEGWR
ncbi:MAG: hypothetical protein JF588_01520 [Caulobacterales bacterium]|nr:hypothetical protein [Caulobacterales bacterium]